MQFGYLFWHKTACIFICADHKNKTFLWFIVYYQTSLKIRKKPLSCIFISASFTLIHFDTLTNNVIHDYLWVVWVPIPCSKLNNCSHHIAAKMEWRWCDLSSLKHTWTLPADSAFHILTVCSSCCCLSVCDMLCQGCASTFGQPNSKT